MSSIDQLPKMKNVLIQCGDHLENQLRILPLAKWLKSRGYNPVVMVYRAFNGTEFLKHGIDVVSLNIKRRSRKNKSYSMLRLDSKLMVNGISYDDVMASELNKSPYLRMDKYKSKNENRFIGHVVSISKVLSFVKPEFIFIWNGYTGLVANFLRVYCAKENIKCSYLERGFKRDSLYVDSQGVNGFGSLSDKGPYECRGGAQVSLSQVKKVLLPLQVQTDTNIIYNSVIKTMRELVFYVREKLADDVVIYVKKHPEEVDGNLNLPFLNNVEYIDECDLNALITSVDLVVTINSTVGMTALFESVPVVSLGKAIFSNKNLTIDKKQFESGVDTFKLNSSSSFRDDLVENYTFCADSPAQNVLKMFPIMAPGKLRAPYNSFKVSPEKFSKYSVLFDDALNKASDEESPINVDVLLGADDGLDLTYRNTNVELTFPWFDERLSLNSEKQFQISFNKTRKRNLSKGINVAMVHTKSLSKPVNTSGYDFVINEYFNVIPSNVLNKGSLSRLLFFSKVAD
jgi:hypothetical protein